MHQHPRVRARLGISVASVESIIRAACPNCQQSQGGQARRAHQRVQRTNLVGAAQDRLCYELEIRRKEEGLPHCPYWSKNFVGWVEQRETHQMTSYEVMGFALLNPSYDLMAQQTWMAGTSPAMTNRTI